MFKYFLPLILVMSLFGSGEVIHACVDTATGTIRIVPEGTVCEANETSLEWGVVGIQGPPGIGDIGCTTDQIAKWDDAQAIWVCSDELSQLTARMNEMENLLAHFSRDGTEITITGANLHVVNGQGQTNSYNGLGNVIIGYNELRTGADNENPANDRSGSHMLVVGAGNNYTRFGGIVAGIQNTAGGEYASVTGGAQNTASGEKSSVSGGYQSTASGLHASVSGGWGSHATGDTSSVSGGRGNTASSHWSSVCGGKENTASGWNSSVAGGETNVASGFGSTVGGGISNTASGDYTWVSGGTYNIANGEASAISGGDANTTDGGYSSIGGGVGNSTSEYAATVSGGWSNTASGYAASVSGGYENVADGEVASVSGGQGRSVSGQFDWRAGSLFQDQ